MRLIVIDPFSHQDRLYQAGEVLDDLSDAEIFEMMPAKYIGGDVLFIRALTEPNDLGLQVGDCAAMGTWDAFPKVYGLLDRQLNGKQWPDTDYLPPQFEPVMDTRVRVNLDKARPLKEAVPYQDVAYHYQIGDISDTLDGVLSSRFESPPTWEDKLKRSDHHIWIIQKKQPYANPANLPKPKSCSSYSETIDRIQSSIKEWTKFFAARSFVEALKTGELEADGKEISNRFKTKRVTIPKSFWRGSTYLKFDDNSVWVCPNGKNTGERRYLEVYVKPVESIIDQYVTQKQSFIDWNKALKDRTGRWAPTDESEKTGQIGWRVWATQNNVPLKIVCLWVRELGMNNAKGAPRRAANENQN